MGAKDQGADATAGRWLVIPRTLCFVTHGDDVLLLKRASHKRVYPGLYNGVGGHLERDEDPLTGAVREIQEETGLELASVRFYGAIHVDAGASNGILVFVFHDRIGGLFVVLTAILWWRHADNIRRLWAGTESRIGAKR